MLRFFIPFTTRDIGSGWLRLQFLDDLERKIFVSGGHVSLTKTVSLYFSAEYRMARIVIAKSPNDHKKDWS